MGDGGNSAGSPAPGDLPAPRMPVVPGGRFDLAPPVAPLPPPDVAGTQHASSPTRGVSTPQPPPPTTRSAGASRPSATAAPIAPRDPAGFRGDIEGLRAIAVLAVLAYHAGVPGLTGGYVGVDVFLVVSGFLITSLLVREARATGSIALGTFWARRVRRLVPASALVVVVTVVASRWLVDPLTQRDVAWDGVLAALGFVINTVFTFRSVDYLTAVEGPFQHYWSLALEETFYLVWPVVVMVCLRRRAARSGTTLLTTVAIAAWAASLIACVRLTRPSDNAVAFFLLPTRAWELLTGALLALAVTRLRMSPRTQRSLGVVGWAGMVAIVAAIVVFDRATAFPGFAAMLPVGATAAVLSARNATDGPRRLLERAPLQWLGARSYTIYLWHWPVLVLPAQRFGPLALPQRLALTGAAVLLAAGTYELFENRIRHDRWLSARRGRTLALGGLMIGNAALAGGLLLVLQPRLDAGDTAAAATPITLAASPALATPSVGEVTVPPVDAVPGEATAIAPAEGSPPTAVPAAAPSPTPAESATTSPRPSAQEALAAATATARTAMEQGVQVAEVPPNLRPSLRKAGSDRPSIYQGACVLDPGVTRLGDCIFGAVDSPTTIVLIGDSHAAQWFPGLEAAALRNGWRLEVITKKGCPAIDFATYDTDGRERSECGPWRAKVLERLATERPALVILASYRYRLVQDPPRPDDVAEWRAGLESTLPLVRPLAGRVLLIGDTPNPSGDVPSCLAGHLRSAGDCLRDRAAAEKPEITAIEREVAAANGAAYASSADWLCGAVACPLIVGDVLLYRDDNHLTATAAEWLSPLLELAIVAALA